MWLDIPLRDTVLGSIWLAQLPSPNQNDIALNLVLSRLQGNIVLAGKICSGSVSGLQLIAFNWKHAPVEGPGVLLLVAYRLQPSLTPASAPWRAPYRLATIGELSAVAQLSTALIISSDTLACCSTVS